MAIVVVEAWIVDLGVSVVVVVCLEEEVTLETRIIEDVEVVVEVEWIVVALVVAEASMEDVAEVTEMGQLRGDQECNQVAQETSVEDLTMAQQELMVMEHPHLPDLNHMLEPTKVVAIQILLHRMAPKVTTSLVTDQATQVTKRHIHSMIQAIIPHQDTPKLAKTREQATGRQGMVQEQTQVTSHSIVMHLLIRMLATTMPPDTVAKHQARLMMVEGMVHPLLDMILRVMLAQLAALMASRIMVTELSHSIYYFCDMNKN